MGMTSHHAAVWLLLLLILPLATSTCLAADDGTGATSAAIEHSASLAHPHEHISRALLVVGGRKDPEVRTAALMTSGPSHRIMHV
jgi:hypothetical protein